MVVSLFSTNTSRSVPLANLHGPVQGALEWLEVNQDKSLEEIKAAAAEQESEEGPALQPGEVPRSLVCNECGKKFRSQAQAEFHASKSEHVDFAESTEEIAPLTEEQKKQKLEDLREKLAAKRAVQGEQEKADKKRNEVWNLLLLKLFIVFSNIILRKSKGRAPRNPRTSRRNSIRNNG